MPPARRHLLAVLLVAATAVSGCAATARTTPAASDGRPQVVVTTSILGDLVARVAGTQAAVEVLMGPGQDPHAFAPSARQVQDLHAADLVVANGLGLEAAVDDVLEAVEADGVPVLHLAEHLDPLAPAEDPDEHEEGHDHADGDPHVWFDPTRMAAGVGVIAEALDEVAAGDWTARADAVAADLRDLDEQVAEVLAVVPPACRRLVVNHDTLRYLAHRYGLEVVATVLPGTSTGAEPSARDFARTVALVRDAGVPAIFVETTTSRRLADALAHEVAGQVAVVELFTGSLGPPGSGADTYRGLLTTDAHRIADALTTCRQEDTP